MGEKDNELKRLIIKEHSVMLLTTFGTILRKSNKKFMILKKSVCAFMANLLLEPEVRSGALKQMLLDLEPNCEILMECCPFVYILQSISIDLNRQEKKFKQNDKKFDLHFKGLIENICSIIINLNYRNTDPKLKLRFKYWCTTFKLNETLFKILEKLVKEKNQIYTDNLTPISRIINVLSKLELIDSETNQALFKASFPYVLSVFSEKGRETGLIDEGIRYVAGAFSESKSQPLYLKMLINQIIMNSKSFKEMLVYIVSNDFNNLNRFVNTCTMCSFLIEIEEKMAEELKMMIGPLIDVIKEKTDLVRKNAAVLLAKLC